MKNKIMLYVLVFASALFTLGSGHLSAQHNHGGHGSRDMESESGSGQGAVKIVMSGNIQFAFEIYDRAKYDEMSMSMKGKPAQGDTSLSHFIIISLIDKTTGQAVNKGTGEIEITAPSGNKIRKKAVAMQGEGMFHFSAGFPMKARGTYKVNAVIHLDGRTIKAATDFTL